MIQRGAGYGGSSVEPISRHDAEALLLSLGKLRYAAFDFETTGLDPSADRIVEIGAVLFAAVYEDSEWRAVVERRYETLINPEMAIPPAASAIHGIDDLDVSAAPTFRAAAPDFFSMLEGAVLIAHNAAFDYNFLLAAARRAQAPEPVNPVYDTVAIAKKAVPGLQSYSLKSLASAFGIIQTAAHRGGDDAEVCMKIFIRCVNLLETGLA